MNNYEKIQSMDLEELSEFLYIHISKKGLKKTEEWLREEPWKEADNENTST